MEYALRFSFSATNNEAEYEAMIVALKLVKSLNITEVLVKGDSKLVIDHIQGKCGVKSEVLRKYHSKALKISPKYQIGIFREKRMRKRNGYLGWPPHITYLIKGLLLVDKYEAKKIQNRNFKFQINQEELYRKSWDGPLLLCVSTEDIPKVLVEVHERWCGSHIGARSLAIKITRVGYYWPTLVKDALSYVKKCDTCQRLGNDPQQPACTVTPIVSPILLGMWGIDKWGNCPKQKGELNSQLLQ
ncbi:hypothetical protein LIER_25027 [Lithospermum erythrorhizon]|uniref:RNase H type-1 domain-containing protein n=1 Tax=Lithospermum erythrorhizon TaxID=34254 RepID=A0AAV3R3A1_LITER